MQTEVLTAKTESLYFACTADRDVISCGGCREEALNNLQDELATRQAVGEGESHAE